MSNLHFYPLYTDVEPREEDAQRHQSTINKLREMTRLCLNEDEVDVNPIYITWNTLNNGSAGTHMAIGWRTYNKRTKKPNGWHVYDLISGDEYNCLAENGIWMFRERWIKNNSQTTRKWETVKVAVFDPQRFQESHSQQLLAPGERHGSCQLH